jgi:hypothetical protein
MPTTIPPIPEPIATPILTPIRTPIPSTPVEPKIVFKMQGGYNMSEWFSFSRKTYRDQIDVKVTIYRYHVRDKYSIAANDQDLPTLVLPAPGYKFLFIWVKAISNSTTPLSGYDYRSFKVDYKGQSFAPKLDLGRIKELLGYYDFNHDYQTTPYGYYWGVNYDTNTKTITQHTKKYIENPVFVVGESNAWDGYILYSVPQTATIEDLIVSASFESMFNARWQFVNGDKFSLASPPNPILRQVGK